MLKKVEERHISNYDLLRVNYPKSSNFDTEYRGYFTIIGSNTKCSFDEQKFELLKTKMFQLSLIK